MDKEHDAFYERKFLGKVDVEDCSNGQRSETDKSRKPLADCP
jgi:hypothetical protein